MVISLEEGSQFALKYSFAIEVPSELCLMILMDIAIIYVINEILMPYYLSYFKNCFISYPYFMQLYPFVELS